MKLAKILKTKIEYELAQERVAAIELPEPDPRVKGVRLQNLTSDGRVYFVQERPDGPVKIGFTSTSG